MHTSPSLLADSDTGSEIGDVRESMSDIDFATEQLSDSAIPSTEVCACVRARARV